MSKKFIPNKPLEKLRNSVVHILMLLVLFAPIVMVVKDILTLKYLFIVFVFVAQMFFIFFFKGRTFSHMIFKTFHKESYKTWQYIVWSVFYSLSVASIIFWVFFPFDLLLLNLVMQYLVYLKTDTTIHQFLAGKMVTGTYE